MAGENYACHGGGNRLVAVNQSCSSVSSSHVDLVDGLVPLGMPKDALMQKLICKHKGLIPDSNVEACQPI